MQLDRKLLIDLARQHLGAPYFLGAKWPLDKTAPQGPIDCSGFVRWLYKQASGILVPDGSYHQYDASEPVLAPLPGDLGFFRDHMGVIDHVGLIADDQDMIEARGEPFHKVLLRPRAKWEAWPLFTGYRRFRSVE